jgi:CRP-like cAMP-binding protein
METLRRIPLFAHCTSEELLRIDRLGTPIDVPAGRVLTREGAAGHDCFVTLDGVAVVERGGRSIGVIEPGSIAGEMALLGHTTRNATVVAETRMQLLVFDHREFAELLDIAPSIEATLRCIIAARCAS